MPVNHKEQMSPVQSCYSKRFRKTILKNVDKNLIHCFHVWNVSIYISNYAVFVRF